MPTIFSDGQGNFFLGQVSFANHSLAYPTTNYFKCIDHSEISLGIQQLCDAAGLIYRDLLPQADFDAMLTTNNYDKIFLYFGTSSDINDRFSFCGTVGDGNSGSTPIHGGFGTYSPCSMYDDSGGRITGSDYDDSGTGILIECGNQILSTQNSDRFNALGMETPTTNRSTIYWTGHATNKSLALFVYQYRFGVADPIRYGFYYAGEPVFTNTNGGGFYSGNIKNRAVCLASTSGDNNFAHDDKIDRSDNRYKINGKHYIVTDEENFLASGRADFALTCQAGTGTPPAQPTKWSTGCFFFHDDTVTGDPAICRMGHLIMATDDQTDPNRMLLGKPEKNVSSQYPEGYNNPNIAWLPVGHFANKVVLMMCWSP